MNFTDYIKYLRFACDVELERLQEFLWCVDQNHDCTGDKYYVAFPTSNCPPDMEDVAEHLKGRDQAADFAIIDGTDVAAREELYEELRQLILYS